MSNDQTWVEALNINPEMLAEWSAQAPQGKPLLVYCLEEGHISVPEYMQWACDHFGLPVLSTGYFHEIFDVKSVKPYRREESWSPWYFPVEQWDGVTFVACVEPPHEEPQDNVRHILADPRAMREVWEAAATAEAPTQETSINEGPQGLTLIIPKVTSVPTQAEEDKSTAAAPEAKEPVADNFDAPVGVNLTAAKSFKLNLDDSTILFKEPEGNTKVAKQAPSENSEVSQIPIHHVETRKAPEKNEYASATSLAVSERLKSYIPTDEDLACRQVFDTLNQHYDHSFIMKCTGEEAVAHKWDDKIQLQDASRVKLSLTFPTFMRVVYRTQMPYHGYLVDSPAHRELFDSLGIKKLPSCVTAIPLKVRGKLWGVLVSVGEEDLQALYQLKYAEGAADQLIKAVESTWAKVA